MVIGKKEQRNPRQEQCAQVSMLCRQKLLELVLEHPEQNTREQLLEKAGELAAGKE
jgi:hypothetical protein